VISSGSPARAKAKKEKEGEVIKVNFKRWLVFDENNIY